MIAKICCISKLFIFNIQILKELDITPASPVSVIFQMIVPKEIQVLQKYIITLAFPFPSVLSSASLPTFRPLCRHPYILIEHIIHWLDHGPSGSIYRPTMQPASKDLWWNHHNRIKDTSNFGCLYTTTPIFLHWNEDANHAACLT